MVREARVSAQLSHPGVVRVLDAGVAERGEPFVAMELLHGADLGKWFEDRGPIPPKTMVALLLPILDALAFVHAKGIVHRDLKPENIFIEEHRDGSVQPKLLDFGIAFAPEVERLTKPGDALGTPAYMAPEQARGTEAGIRSDLWALCVVLYEAIDGGLPFDAPNYHALLQAILHDEPRRPGFAMAHPELWRIIRRGLAKNPGDRWSDARTLGGHLARWSETVGQHDDITGRPLRPSWSVEIESVHPEDQGRARKNRRWVAATTGLVAVASWAVVSIPVGGPTTQPHVGEAHLAVVESPLAPEILEPSPITEPRGSVAPPGPDEMGTAVAGATDADPSPAEAVVEETPAGNPTQAVQASLDSGGASAAMPVSGAPDDQSVAPRLTRAPGLKPLKDPFE